MKEEKVSVIIAAYNVERYIKECIMSIEKQIYKNLEIILIDDGSQDKTGNICDELQKKYNNIIVKHIENSGVSKARNIAISMSTGKYLAFVDGDDYIEKNMISVMIKKIEEEEADLCVCNYFNYYVNKKQKAKFNVKENLNKEEAKKELLNNDSIRGFMCNKIFKAKYIKENLIVFDENITMCEDALFCFQYMQYIEKVVVTNIPLYNYRMRKSSAVNVNDKKNISVFDAFNKMHKLDDKIYQYSKDLYTYLYFKYYRDIRKEKKVKNVKKVYLINTLLSIEIKPKTKIYAILFLILPQKIKNKMRNLKKDNLQYFE